MRVLHRYAFLNEIAGARIFSHARVNAPEKDQSTESTEGWLPPRLAGIVFDPAWPLGNGIRSGTFDLAMYWVDRFLCRKSHVFFVLTSIIRGPEQYGLVFSGILTNRGCYRVVPPSLCEQNILIISN